MSRAHTFKKLWSDPEMRQKIILNSHSGKVNQKRALSMTGRKQSEETKKKRSETMKKLWSTPIFREKTLAGHNSEEARRKMSPIGRKHSLETRMKIGLAHKGRKHSEEHVRKIAMTKIGNKNCVGRIISEETRQRMSEAHKGVIPSERARKRMSEARKGNKYALGHKHSKDVCKKMSEKAKGRRFSLLHCQKIGLANKRRWSDPVIKAKTMGKMFKSLGVKPNRQEKLLTHILDDLFPGEYKFVGDFSFSLGGKSPDFMNVNGQKKLIELFGDYWHKNDNEADRVCHFEQYGFRTLIVWERELKDRDLLKKRLVDFHNYRN